MSAKGRVDILLENLLAQYVKKASPIVEAAFHHARPAIQATLRDTVGPNTKIGKRTRRALAEAQDFQGKVNEVRKRRGIA